MSINRIHSASLSHINQISHKPEAPHTEKSKDARINTDDSFSKSTSSGSTKKSFKNASSALTGMADKVFNSKNLDKSNFKYHIQDQTSGPDGTLFVAYSDYNSKEGNYISAIGTDGKVKWEVSAGENGLECIKAGNDGVLYAKTQTGLVAFNPDGKHKFLHEFDEPVVGNKFVQDSNGNSYFRKSSGNELYVVSNEGSHAKLPLKLRGAAPGEIKAQPDGTFLMKDGKKISRVDPSSGEVKQSFEFQETDPKLNRSPEDFMPSADGGMLVVARQTTYVNNSHEFDGDLHMGLSGMGFRRWHHHMPPIDDYRSSSYNTDYIFKYDQTGNLQWQTGDIGVSGTPLPLPDNRTLIKGTYNYSEKKADIRQINADGTIGLFATVEGGNIDELRFRESDSHVFASQGDKLRELDLNGNVVNTYSMEGNKAGMFVRGFEKDGKILLNKENSLYRWDPSTDSLTSLTDHSMDYSYKVTLTDATDIEPEGPAKTVEKKESEVIIGGVKLKINKS
ncbi:MAG: hypothetical protein LWY06_09950 [Firmicutes bacterium]|nr:hypothetical protein [Bacillota bacterium]